MAEALLSWDATEACGTVKLAEIKVFDGKEPLLVEIPTDIEYHDIVIRLDLGVRLSPRLIF